VESELRPPASQKALLIQVLYRAWKGAGLSAFTPNAGAVVTVFLGLATGGCSLSQGDGPFAMMMDKVKTTGRDVTGSIKPADPTPTESDLAFARNAASDVLTKGNKDSSQPWQNPETGARGSVTPLAQAYASDDGRTCRDFLASYVNGKTENWLQGSACHGGNGRWEIHNLRPWRPS
jgi:surface antigen